jgi:hypothetical protein
MYISRLVKTRILHLGLLINHHPVSLISLVAHLDFSSLALYPFHLLYHFSFPIHLLSIHIGGSAAMPSHTQSGPSVAIPSVRRLKLSHQRLHPHYIVQVGLRLAKRYKRRADALGG